MSWETYSIPNVRLRDLFKRIYILGLVFGFCLCSCAGNKLTERDRHIRWAQKYAEGRQFPQAADELQKAIRLDPNSASTYFQLGLVDREENHNQDAAKAFQSCLDLDPQNISAAVQLGEIYLMANHIAHARQLAEGALAKNARDVPARLLLAKSYMGDRDFGKAAAEFEKARQGKPNDPAIYLAMGLAEIGLRNPHDAESNFKSALTLDKTRTESYQDLANLYLGTDRPKEAEQVLEQGIQNNPDNPQLQFALADFYCRTGDLPQAKRVTEELGAQAKNPQRMLSALGDFWTTHGQPGLAADEYKASLSVQDSAITKKKLVNALITLGDVAEAKNWNDEILQTDPHDHEALMFLGAIDYLQGRSQDAVALLQRASADDPSSVFAHYYLGAALLAERNYDLAKRQFFECIKSDDKFTGAYLKMAQLSLEQSDSASAALYARQAIHLNPQSLDGYLLAADAAILGRDASTAQLVLRAASRVAPDNYLVHERWAAFYALKNNFPQAEKEYWVALASSKNPGETLSLMTNFYMQRHQYSDGLGQLNAYLASRGPSPLVYELIAELRLGQGDFAKSILACQKAIVLDPKQEPAYLYMGQALTQLGRLDEAEKTYEKAIELIPGQPMAYQLLAGLYVRKGDFTKAAQTYEDALKIAPESPIIQAELARALAESGQNLDQALSIAQKAKEELPNAVETSDVLAWVYHKKGLDNVAIPLLKGCVARAPANPFFRYDLGMAYLKIGSELKAEKMLNSALENGLGAPYQANARQALISIQKQQLSSNPQLRKRHNKFN